MKKVLDEQKVNVRVLISGLWAAFMFLYIYVDYFHLYMPNKIQDILDGRVFEFDITQGFIFIALFLATIPIVMIYLTLALSAKASRLANMIVGVALIPYMLFNLVGDAWPHMYYAAAVEVAMLALIIRYAKNWPAFKK